MVAWGEMHALSPDPLLLAIIPYDSENVLATSVSIGPDSFWNNSVIPMKIKLIN